MNNQERSNLIWIFRNKMLASLGKYEKAKEDYATWKKVVETSRHGIDRIDAAFKQRKDAISDAEWHRADANTYALAAIALGGDLKENNGHSRTS